VDEVLCPGRRCWRVALFPLFRPPLDGFMDDCILALAYVVMALGLNLVVGFAGLLDLGYVAFYAFGAMTVGWWASDFYTGVGGDKGIHIGVSGFAEHAAGIHVNFLLILIGAIIVCAIAGAIIGLTDAAAARRLHRDRDARLRRDHRTDLPATATRSRSSATTSCRTGASRSRRSIDRPALPRPVQLRAQPQAVLLDDLRGGARGACS
jgi:hypothetical protein